MWEMQINILVISVLIISSIILVVVLVLELISRLSVDAALNEQIIVADGEQMGDAVNTSVELYASELQQLQTIFGDDQRHKNTYDEKEVSRKSYQRANLG